MWWKQSESIYFDWIMTDLFCVYCEYENAVRNWPDEKWRAEFAQKTADRGYSAKIGEFVQKELERFLPWRMEEAARWEAERLKREQEEREEKEWQQELKQLSEKELTPFEEVLNEVFDNVYAVIDAAYHWSDEEWHNQFEEKITVKINSGRFTRETAVQIRKDLDEYMVMLQKDKEEYEKEQKVLEKEKQEQERLKREELEKTWAEDKAREQRKAKQLPEVLEVIHEYNLARKALKEKPSTEHYHKVFKVCYCIMGNWDIVSCLDEFEGVFEYYEKCAFDYLHTAKTVDSLYHIVFYYTNEVILSKLHDTEAKKKHLKEGQKYVKAFHQIMDDEKSAIMYINCYLLLNQNCNTNEDLEALYYAVKAYKLAKKFTLKFKSKAMLDELDLAKLGLTVYYRVHGQQKEAEHVEKEFEEIKRQIHLC